MELKTLTCPSCGASLQIPEGKDRFFCTFCGSQIQVDDGRITIDINANVNVNQRYTDVARMRELDLQERELQRIEERERRERLEPIKWWLAIIVFSVIGGILLMSSFLHSPHDANNEGVSDLLSVWFLYEMIGSFVFTAKAPKKYVNNKHGCLSRIGIWFLFVIASEFISVLSGALIVGGISMLFG